MSKRTLNTKKTISVHIFHGTSPIGQSEIYFRNHEIAAILDIKQPFEFSKKLSDKYPYGVICGDWTASFRKDTDNGRTVFIAASALCDFLTKITNDNVYIGLNVNKKQAIKLLDELESLNKEVIEHSPEL